MFKLLLLLSLVSIISISCYNIILPKLISKALISSSLVAIPLMTQSPISSSSPLLSSSSTILTSKLEVGSEYVGKYSDPFHPGNRILFHFYIIK